MKDEKSWKLFGFVFFLLMYGLWCLLLIPEFEPLQKEAMRIKKEGSLPDSINKFSLSELNLSDSISRTVEIISVLKEKLEGKMKYHEKNGYPSGGPGSNESKVALQSMILLKEKISLASTLISSNPRVAIKVICEAENRYLQIQNKFKRDDLLDTYEFMKGLNFLLLISGIALIIYFFVNILPIIFGRNKL